MSGGEPEQLNTYRRYLTGLMWLFVLGALWLAGRFVREGRWFEVLLTALLIVYLWLTARGYQREARERAPQREDSEAPL